MKDDLLYYYNQELTTLRKLAAEFAKQHPKVAGHLRLNSNTVEDPHVARLLETFALLSARTQHRLDDDFSELSDSLLNIVYPHYQSPIPSMAVVQFAIDENMLTTPYPVNKNTLIVSDNKFGSECTFSTCYPIALRPIEIANARLKGQPLLAPKLANRNHHISALELRIKTTKPTITFAELECDTLQFYLNTPAPEAFMLYELLSQHCQDIIVASDINDTEAIALDKGSLQPLGFAKEEGMLPYEPRTFIGYRLLTEFFSFPEKFLFFEIKNLAHAIEIKGHESNELSLFFYFDKNAPTLEHLVNKDSFAFHCTPAINLFPTQAEPIDINGTKSEYPIVVNASEPADKFEIYNIQRVCVIDQEHHSTQYQPFYGLKYGMPNSGNFWSMQRRPGWDSERYVQHGTEVYVTFSEFETKPSYPGDQVAQIELLCTNRNKPSQLRYHPTDPLFSLLDRQSEYVSAIRSLTRITPSTHPTLKHQASWHLISHFSLNFLSLTESKDDEQAYALREMLRLYNFVDSNETNAMIDAIVHITSEPIVLRHQQGIKQGFVQGIAINLTIDETKFGDSSLYLFASILERFFALYCNINSFTRLTIYDQNQKQLYQWQPQAGEKSLL